MKRKDERRIESLRWILEFLSDDLEEMSDLELRKRALEAGYEFLPEPMVLGDFESDGFEAKDDEDRDFVESFKTGDFRYRGKEEGKAFRFGMNVFEQSWWIKSFLPEVQTHLGRILRHYTEILTDTERKREAIIQHKSGEEDCYAATPYTLVKVYLGLKVFGGTFEVFYGTDPFTLEELAIDGESDEMEEPDFESMTKEELNKDLIALTRYATIRFCTVLDGIPREAIKTCQECGKYFLHLTKKPKFYCNPKCTSRAMARKRREADPEKYRAQQREIMRRKYKEQKAAKQGVSVDEVEIQKRSTPKKSPKGGK